MLFDTNGIYYMDDSPNNYDFAIDIMNNKKDYPVDSKTIKIYNPDEALKSGNAFPNLYEGYKNYSPKDIKISSTREKALLEIQMLDFSINDLNLYLDLNPNDAYTFQILKKYIKEYKTKKESYAEMYGPLTLECITEKWEWSNGIWPWEEGNGNV